MSSLWPCSVSLPIMRSSMLPLPCQHLPTDRMLGSLFHPGFYPCAFIAFCFQVLLFLFSWAFLKPIDASSSCWLPMLCLVLFLCPSSAVCRSMPGPAAIEKVPSNQRPPFSDPGHLWPPRFSLASTSTPSRGMVSALCGWCCFSTSLLLWRGAVLCFPFGAWCCFYSSFPREFS